MLCGRIFLTTMVLLALGFQMSTDANETANSSASEKILGDWNVLIADKPAIIHFKRLDNGVIGTLDIAMGDVSQFNLDSVEVADTKVTIRSRKRKLKFALIYNPQTDTWNGHCLMSGHDSHVIFPRVDGQKNPQEPLPPFPYEHRDVRFAAKDKSLRAGTLTYPK